MSKPWTFPLCLDNQRLFDTFLRMYRVCLLCAIFYLCVDAERKASMPSNLVEKRLFRVHRLLEEGRVAEASELVESLLPADRADLFERLDGQEQDFLIPQFEVEERAHILEELEEEEAAEVASRINVKELASIVDEMAPDEAADLLGDVDPALGEATLAYMSRAEEVSPLLLHPDETAGGLMTSEYLAFPQSMWAGRVLAAMRDWEPKGQESSYLFVVDEDTRLVGVVSVLDVVRAEPYEPLSFLMDTSVLKVHVSDDQETAARLAARYDLMAVPVVDDRERLVGVITVEDLVEVLEEEDTEDIQRIAGSEPLERPYLDVSIPAVVWKRVGWLLLLFVTGTLTSSVMRLFQDQLAAVVILSIFIPLLIGTGGNVGSQVTVTIIRALAVGHIGLNDALQVLWRELRVAFLLGLLLGSIAFALALMWSDSSVIAGIVTSSIFAIVLWADSVGALLPMVATKVGIDPALISGPLMSTLVDATGLLIYFSIARLVLGA